jgi:hypothetical protein
MENGKGIDVQINVPEAFDLIEHYGVYCTSARGLGVGRQFSHRLCVD